MVIFGAEIGELLRFLGAGFGRESPVTLRYFSITTSADDDGFASTSL